MSDIVESLDHELQRQKSVNDKLLALLAEVNAALGPDDRLSRIMDEAWQTKQVLNDCQRDLDEKKKP